METAERLREILRDVLQLGPAADALNASSRLLGSIPQLDSMAVVAVLTTIEDEFGIGIEDDAVSADVFATFGALADFVDRQIAP